jgi:hypothetical protein
MNKILYTLILVFFIIAPVNANSDNFIVFQDTKNSATSYFVYYAQTDDLCSEMDKMSLSQEFQDYLRKNGINTDDYELNLVSSSSNTHPQVIIHTPNYEFHYAITNVTDSSITANNEQLILRASWNRFKVANKSGRNLAKVKVAYYQVVSVGGQNLPIILQSRESMRYNLANDRVLNYDPSAEFNSATINIFPNMGDVFSSAGKTYVPLGNWHTAYVKKDKNYYIQLA